MKRTICALLCLALGCGLLAGCGGKPKIPPENFPHSETLRLDATIEEVIRSEDLKKNEDFEKLNPSQTMYIGIPVMIDGTEVTAVFLSKQGLDQMRVTYGIFAEEADLDKEFQHFLKYFSKMYGTGSEGLAGSEVLKRYEWTYLLDETQYNISLARRHAESGSLRDWVTLDIIPSNYPVS